MLLNSDFMQEAAQAFSERLQKEGEGDPWAQVALAIRLTLGREPEVGEVQDHLDFIARIQEQHQLEPQVAWRNFALAMFNLNEFIFLD